MVKTSISSTKYVIYGIFSTKLKIDKPDLIGAFFGQTEGLIGDDLEFQNLQKTGKLGRIDIKIKKVKTKFIGEFTIPTALDKVEVSLVAAAIESITKIGHTTGIIKIKDIKDEREDKRKEILKRAEELLSNLKEKLPDSNKISLDITSNISKRDIRNYGEEIYGGSKIKYKNELILVEGRADVLNLLKNGFSNVLSINGNQISNKLINLTSGKVLTAFLDDDRGGRENLKLLESKININNYVFAPNGKEVEELTYKEILKCLKNKKEIEFKKDNNIIDKIKIIVEEVKSFKKEIDKNSQKKEVKVENNKQNDKKHFSKIEFEKISLIIEEIQKTKEYVILNKTFRKIKSDKLSNITKLKTEKGEILIFDGICENSVFNKAVENNIKIIICRGKSRIKNYKGINIKLFDDFFGE